MFGVVMFFDEGGQKRLNKSYLEEGKAEEVAWFLLGTKTPLGVISKTWVTDADENLLGEFEY